MKNIDPKLYPQYNFKFDGVKETYDTYKFDKDNNGNLIVINKKTNIITSDPLIMSRLKFSVAWVKSTQISHPRTSPSKELTEHDYMLAFDYNARKTYAIMMAIIKEQLLKTGNINPLEIIDYIEKHSNEYSKYSSDYINNLFSKKIYVEAVDRWARYAIPDALMPTKELMTIDEYRWEDYFKTNKTL